MIQTGMKLGPFVIDKELGSGAMGTVYRAKYKETTPVAIKVMAPGIGSNETALARFEREAAILKQLKHPHIVRLLATGRYKNSPFYAMEYIEGESLDKVMLRRGRLSWEEVVEIGQQLCGALQHAHDQGIIHRDLKPSNLMVLADGTIKLTDFGIAKDLGSTGLTATNCTVGTASYMSPEQCKGDRNIGPKSDLYSMGVMFYELVTGRKPFEAESTMDMFLQHVKGTFERPSRHVMDLPIWLDTLICQLLEKKPEDRPFNAEMVGRTLADIKDKVEAQESAGMKRATMRNVERQETKTDRMTKEEREAARALLRKKKKKKKALPIHQQGWFQLGSITLTLAFLVFLVYFVFIKAPSLEALHQQTAALMNEADFARAGDALAGPLAAFDQYYARSEGSLAADMRHWKDEAQLIRREEQMYNRRKNFRPDSAEEELARQALDEEELGKLQDAHKTWDQLASKKTSDNQDKYAWALVAEKHANAITDIFKQLDTMREKVLTDFMDEYKGESPEEKLAVLATRAEVKRNDPPKALELWDELKVKTEGEKSKSRWYLLAAFKVRELRMTAAVSASKEGKGS